MNQWFRPSDASLRPTTRQNSTGARPGSLRRRAGRADSGQRETLLEALEARQLLTGDYPSFAQVFNTSNPQIVPEIQINGTTGIGVSPGTLAVSTDDDVARFTAIATDFVTVWADTKSLGGTFNSRVDVYTGTPGGQATLVASGLNNGTLTTGDNSDGWVGFIAQAGTTYYVRVRSENAQSGNYNFRVDALTTAIPALNATNGQGQLLNQNLNVVGGDTVYKMTIPSGSQFDSLMTVGLTADATDIDTRLDVYDSTGKILVADSDTGFLSNSYSAFKASPNQVVYIRARADAFALAGPNAPVSTGAYNILVDGIATTMQLDPVTRRAFNTGVAGFQTTASFSFVSMGAGQSFITGIPQAVGPIPPMADPAMRLYDSKGVQIAFNDDFNGVTPQLELVLKGNTRYYVVMEGFDLTNPSTGGFRLSIEANHTLNPILGQGVDDHEDDPTGGALTGDALRQAFNRATPILWGAPRGFTDSAQNPIFDRGFVIDGVGTGRIFDDDGVDTDLFKFVPPIDMVSDYPGVEDDLGTFDGTDRAIFAGGQFTVAGQAPVGTNLPASRAAFWDGGDWFATRRGVNGTIRSSVVYNDPTTPANNSLILGGTFSQAFNDPTPLGIVPVTNIVRYRWVPAPTNQYLFEALPPLGTANSVVTALTTWDPPVNPTSGLNLPEAVVAAVNTTVNGVTTGNVFVLDARNPFALSWLPLSTFGPGFGPFDGPVNALAIWDMPDPDGPDPKSGTPNLPDPPEGLIVGGNFTDKLNYFNFEFDPQAANPAEVSKWKIGNLNGAVNALTLWDRQQLDTEPLPINGPYVRLVVGGDFTQNGTTAANRIIAFTERSLAETPTVGEGPILAAETLGAGFNNSVYALTTYDHDADDETDRRLVAGGAFTAGGLSRIAEFDIAPFAPNGTWAAMGGGVNGTVRALHTYLDQSDAYAFGVQEAIYVGGEFTTADGIPALRTAKWDFNPNLLIPAYVWGGLDRTTVPPPPSPNLEPNPTLPGSGGTNGFGVNNTVYTITSYDDGDPTKYERNDRAGTRLAIVVSPDVDAFLNAFIRVYDSQFNLIYSNNTIAPPFPDPAGSVDPSLAPGTTEAFRGPKVWGGETYYIAVSGLNNAGSGRYTLQVTADAFSNVDLNSLSFEPGNAPNLNAAQEIILIDTVGDQRYYFNSSTAPLKGSFFKQFKVTKSSQLITQASDFGRLETPGDTDIYFFTAARSGTAEVRINTTGITQEFGEQVTNFFTGAGGLTGQTKLLNSELDSALRIFDADLEEVDYNDDFSTNGAADPHTVGLFGTGGATFGDPRQFTGRDPRVVFEVEAGKRYYIQVESAQNKALANALPYEISPWSQTGIYELFINTTPNFDGIDDHSNYVDGAPLTFFNLATPINIGITEGRPDFGTGSITGRLKDITPQNTNDTDLFTFIAPSSGVSSVTLESTVGSGFTGGTVRVLDATGAVLGSGTMNGANPITIQVNTIIGDRFFVAVEGDGTGPGTGHQYRVRLSGLELTDDHANLYKLNLATKINKNLYDYDGTETLTGILERAGDTDVFRFETIAFEDTAQIVVKSLNTNVLKPVVRVYEVQIDPVGTPTLWQIAADTVQGNEDTAIVNFPLTGPNRTTPVTPPPPQQTYNFYYIVVEGQDVNFDSGAYTVSINLQNKTDDYADAGQWTLAQLITLNASTGVGTAPGNIEATGDTDIFLLQPAAAGDATITITSTSVSTLLPRVRIYDKDFNPLTDTKTNQTIVTGPDTLFSVAQFKITVERDVNYYIVVEGATGGVIKSTNFGTYSLFAFTPAADDHANAGEFQVATPVILSPFTGDGDALGVIGETGDTDLFSITAIEPGKLTFKVGTPGSFITPVIQLFASDGSPLGSAVTDGGVGDEDGFENGSVQVSRTALTIGTKYFALVSASPTGPVGNELTGSYEFLIDGPLPSGTPIDDYANAGEFDLAAAISLDSVTGTGQRNGLLGTPIDTDLFKFTSLRGGRAFIQVVTPKGATIDAGVQIFDADQNLIASNTLGNVAANAFVKLDVDPNAVYYVLVTGDGVNTSEYQVRVNVEPETFFLYFPEGYASNQIREYVSIANSNPFDVNYTIRLRYATGELETIVANNREIKASSRGGITLSNGALGAAPGVRLGVPYAIIVESDGKLGATFAHYDFDAPLGETLTDKTSETWTFPQVRRAQGIVKDYILVYNPNPNDITVQLTAYTDNGEVTVSRTIEAGRRGGWNINNTPGLPVGAFAVKLTSAPVIPGAPHIGVVASLSHYDLAATSGDASLGDPTGGSIVGVYNGLLNSGASTAELVLFNPGDLDAEVTFTGTYIGSNLPGITRTLTVPAKTSRTFTGTELNLTVGQPVGVRYESSQPLSVLGRSLQFEDGDATLAATEVGTNFFFGDAFINVPKAGISYFEDLYFYNPAASPINVTLDILFNDATRAQVPVTLAADTFTRVELHDLQAILQRGGKVNFSLEIFGNDPFAVTMTHYDLILKGGWGTKGAPTGLTNPLANFS
jgi:hypothetical protein